VAAPSGGRSPRQLTRASSISAHRNALDEKSKAVSRLRMARGPTTVRSATSTASSCPALPRLSTSARSFAPARGARAGVSAMVAVARERVPREAAQCALTLLLPLLRLQDRRSGDAAAPLLGDQELLKSDHDLVQGPQPRQSQCHHREDCKGRGREGVRRGPGGAWGEATEGAWTLAKQRYTVPDRPRLQV